ncbi:MAG: MotA/TolQ/ExbB proton channel family protein [Nitrospiria bacterium]
MKIILPIRLLIIVLHIALLPLDLVSAEPVNTLDDLLSQIREDHHRSNQENKAREARFITDKGKQKNLLERAKESLAAEEQQSKTLKKSFDENELRLSAMETDLKKRTGSLGELFGIVRQNARESEGLLSSSLVSAQLKGRSDPLKELSQSKALPSIGELEDLWLVLLEEMTESGKVVKFPAAVTTTDGEEEERLVTRIGLFTAISAGKYLRHFPETGKLVELGRQPSSRFLKMARALEEAKSGLLPMAVDPSRGATLALLVKSPGYLERIRQGGMIGYFILALGGIALTVVAERFLYLSFVERKIFRQTKDDEPKGNNALGRIMIVYTENPEQETETLSHKLGEAILKETPQLERGLTMIAVFAAVAPLLGLLGTVTGMIETFQSITLFGTGDPKLMSGGISQALITTELGLIVAIPIVLLHSLLTGKSNRLIQILDEQSAGMVATLSEKQDGIHRTAMELND